LSKKAPPRFTADVITLASVWNMPTDRRRYMITATDEVQSALAVAARRWPGEMPSQLLYRLIQEGQRALDSGALPARTPLPQSARRGSVS
jgi:hypothetical protein